MAKLTIQFEVDQGWDMVDMHMPSCGGPDNDRCTTCDVTNAANGPAAYDGDRKAKRLLGMYVIKRQTGLSQARLKEYFMGVNHDSAMATADAATRSRQRTRKRNDRDFVAIVYKLILVHDAKQRFRRMLNWHKLLILKLLC